MGRSPVTRGSRVLVILDSLVGLDSLAKGRSASRRLNRDSRKLAAYAVLSNVERLFHWVPTEHQASDAAFRRSAPATPLTAQIKTALNSVSALQRNAVAPHTFQVYRAGVPRFAAFCCERYLLSSSAYHVDDALQNVLLWIFQDEPSRGANIMTVHAVFDYELIVPAHRKKLIGCLLALRGWDCLVPCKSPRPFPAPFSTESHVSVESGVSRFIILRFAFNLIAISGQTHFLT